MVLGTFRFAHFWCRLTKSPKLPDQGTTGRTRGLHTERSFSMMQDFRQSSEGVGSSQVSTILRQLTGQISAHYSSSNIRNTHLRLFRPDQGPHLLCFAFFVHFLRTLLWTKISLVWLWILVCFRYKAICTRGNLQWRRVCYFAQYC